MTNTLEKICADKKNWIQAKKTKLSLKNQEEFAAEQPPTRGFLDALRKTEKNAQLALIAEIKKASPSRGLIRQNFNPTQLAKDYEAGGATCLSVLTDEPYFQGCDAYLQEAKSAVSLPLLRKDFILDPYQVIESRALGADAILLIIAALDGSQAQELESVAQDLGMSVLVEVHNQKELEQAQPLSSPLLGINNRNLKTLEVNLQTTRDLAPLADPQSFLICESGLYSHEDLVEMKKVGAKGFLIGESLMRQENVLEATQKILGHL